MGWGARSVLANAILFLLLPYNQNAVDPGPAARAISHEYSISNPERVPMVVVATVVRGGRVTVPEPFQLPRRDAQLWRARIQIENVLQGDAHNGEVDVFYFLYGTPGSARPLILSAGERDVFLLMRDHGELRTICDAARNCCAIRVLTGAHPQFQPTPGASIEQTITELLFSRGSGSRDRDVVKAIETQAYRLPFKEGVIVETLQSLQTHDSPLVGEAACYALRSRRLPCADALPGEPHHHATCGVAQHRDSFEITIEGPPNKPVYRSSVDARRTVSTRIGKTDVHGHFAIRETRDASGAMRTEVWSVGSVIASPAVTYVHGSTVVTPVNGERDRYGSSLSSQAIADGHVTTYAAVQLSYPASLYYDVGIASRTLQERDGVKNAQAFGVGFASVLTVTAPVVSMHDYVSEAKAYVKPTISKQGEFLNPFRFGEGSCFGSSASCQIIPISAPDRVKYGPILLGSTRNDQTAVPQSPAIWNAYLDAADQQSSLKSLLAGLDRMPDSWATSLIRTVAAEGGYLRPVLTAEMRDLAQHGRPAVRLAACKVLTNLEQTCPKSLNAHPLPAPPEPTPPALDPDPLKDVAAPHYVVYRCFLDMIDRLRHTNPATPWPFPGRRDERRLALLRQESDALQQQLAGPEQSARKVIADFRAHAQSQAEPEPAGIYELEALRLAIEVQHMAHLQSRLGKRGTLEFEAFLAGAFIRP